jgi:hypothetical protein
LIRTVLSVDRGVAEQVLQVLDTIFNYPVGDKFEVRSSELTVAVSQSS